MQSITKLTAYTLDRLQYESKVYELPRYYSIEDGEPVGPHWKMTFLIGTISTRGPAAHRLCTAVSRPSH